MKKVLILQEFSPESQTNIFRALGDTPYAVIAPDKLTAQDVADATAIIGRLPQKLIPEAKNLEYLQLCSAGADAYLAPGLLPESVALCNATGAYGHAVSEHLFAGVLSVVKKLHLYRATQRDHFWGSHGSVRAVEDLTVLVIGPGDIGGRFAQLMRMMGAKIICVRRTVAEKPDFADEVYTVDALNDVLPRADVVAMAVPGSASTYHMIGAAQFAVMKRGVILGNVGRGNAIDPKALCDAIDRGIVEAAFLDVTEPEPLPDNDPLWDKPEVFITPHVAGGFHMRQTDTYLGRIIAENITHYLAGEPLTNLVDRETGYKAK